jgi:hypothetical protein
MADLAQKIYEGSAEVGSWYAYFGLIFAIIIALCMSGSSFYLFNKDESNLIKARANVLKADCQNTIVYDSKGRAMTNTTCLLDIEYIVNNVTYKNKVTTSGTHYANQIIDITYDKNDPNIVSAETMSSKTMAMILCGIAILLLLCSGVNYYFTQKSKTYASIYGVASTVDLARNIIRN